MLTIENTAMKINTATALGEEILLTAGEEAAVDYSKKEDGKVLLLLKSTGGEEKVTLLKGNALQGASDMEITVESGEEMALVVESGRFVNDHGELKGKMLMTGKGVSLRVIELP